MVTQNNRYHLFSDTTQTKFGIAASTGEQTPLVLCNQQTAQALVHKLNESDLSPIHLNDVIRDFILQQFLDVHN